MATTQSYNTNRPKQGSKALWFRPKRLIALWRQVKGQDEAQGRPDLVGPIRVLYGHEKPRRPLRSRHDADEVEHGRSLSRRLTLGFSRHDQSADKLGNLGDYGVAEASKSVHPPGNPMSHSTHVGFNCPPA